ncbi:MAG: hypothetical protein JSY10_20900 [Paenibacillus sp.]|nr:hypothetical protein [Paenibacillus sp.]
METFWYDRATTYEQEKLFQNIDMDVWNLTSPQQKTLRSVTVSDICGVIDIQIVRGLESLLKHSFSTSRTLILAFEYCAPFDTQTHPWIPWVEKILESKEKFTNSKYLPMMKAQEPNDHITISDLMEETIQMSINFLNLFANATISYSQDNLEDSQDPSNIDLKTEYPEIKLDAIINIG